MMWRVAIRPPCTALPSRQLALATRKSPAVPSTTINPPRRYVNTLRVWTLYDCSGIQQSREDEVMADMWRRWKATRRKPVTANLAVTQYSLDESWTAFVRRWNSKSHFGELLPYRKEQRRKYGLSDLREKVCTMCWNAGRPYCYLRRCKGCQFRRGEQAPTRDEWELILAQYPMTVEELP
ncbi:unnamed protein product [Peronospora belbahrii]|uniref:Uncharacterized protein n=1 Tax=Peronospora belbahrii TaxID=622444 RepID=A0AAU9KMW1_9STRA|nr:unnamed protein product [Peronospora belbahrii]